MNLDDIIYVAGHTGMVGGAVLKHLTNSGYKNLLTASRKQLDLTNQDEVRKWFKERNPTFVFLCAARVGGIAANLREPAQFLYDNLMIQTNVIDASYRNNVSKLLYLGSSCIYPRLAPQPMKEEFLLTGPLEPTNEAYAVAKISGLKMCEYYKSQFGFNTLSLIPPNLYGPGDDFSIQRSHVVAALIRRIHEANMNKQKSVEIWGTGNARRELMFVDDFSKVAVELMNTYTDDNFLNVGTGTDSSILELANMISEVIGFKGEIIPDLTKPDGMPRKIMDVSRFRKIYRDSLTPLREGLQITYEWFLNQIRISSAQDE